MLIGMFLLVDNALPMEVDQVYKSAKTKRNLGRLLEVSMPSWTLQTARHVKVCKKVKTGTLLNIFHVSESVKQNEAPRPKSAAACTLTCSAFARQLQARAHHREPAFMASSMELRVRLPGNQGTGINATSALRIRGQMLATNCIAPKHPRFFLIFFTSSNVPISHCRHFLGFRLLEESSCPTKLQLSNSPSPDGLDSGTGGLD